MAVDKNGGEKRARANYFFFKYGERHQKLILAMSPPRLFSSFAKMETKSHQCLLIKWALLSPK